MNSSLAHHSLKIYYFLTLQHLPPSIFYDYKKLISEYKLQVSIICFCSGQQETLPSSIYQNLAVWLRGRH